MDLFDILFGVESNNRQARIAVILFVSLLREYAEGRMTPAQVVSAINAEITTDTQQSFTLNTAGVNQLTALKNRLDAAANKSDFLHSLQSVLVCMEMRVSGYTTKTQIKNMIEAF